MFGIGPTEILVMLGVALISAAVIGLLVAAVIKILFGKRRD